MPNTRGDFNGCVATITTDEYAPGTAVLFASLLRHNPWFSGDLVVLHDGLSQVALSRLGRFPRVVFREVGRDLRARAREVSGAVVKAARKSPNLYALEAFALGDYARVVKIDSDIACAGDIAPLFAVEAPLACCADHAGIRGRMRDRDTYAPVRPDETAPADAIARPFNTGVMSIAPQALGTEVYEALVDDVRPESWARVASGHADSVVLNRRLGDRWSPLPEIYNYLLPPAPASYARPRAPLADAVLLHFLGHPKPWQPGRRAETDDRRTGFAIWDREAGLAG